MRRKSRAEEPDDTEAAEATSGGAADTDEGDGDAAAGGPYDVDDAPDDGVERVDLGSLLVPPVAGRELRLQVDEQSGTVQSVALAGKDGALELRAFAAPRNGDLWEEVRPQIVADFERRGGTATEREGRFGPELSCLVKVRTQDGQTGNQPSRIIGVNGSRWLLRATLLGRPALEPDDAGEWEDVLAGVVVRRGDHAMPVGEALPLTLPENARRMGSGGPREA